MIMHPMAGFLQLSRRNVASRILRICSNSRSMAIHPSHGHLDHPLYVSSVDAEPLHLYKPGGYHPIKLGDYLKSGRYKVVHKLGWGGYSTVWAAKDQREEIYVAIKICVAERDGEMRELQMTKALSSCHPRLQYTAHIIDSFNTKGPNGDHKCLVYELLGPNIPDAIGTHFPSGRLPGRLAKIIARQALIGLDHLYQRGVGHGDLHTRNLAFTMPHVDTLSERCFVDMLGAPEVGKVRRRDGKPVGPSLPEYIVRAASYQGWTPTQAVKIIDLGESFLNTKAPKTLHTPLPLRAPEVIFQYRVDYRVDLWSLGCMLFELFTGQPPFDTFMTTPTVLVRQMQDTASDFLPVKWQNSWAAMKEKDNNPRETPGPDLQEWLEDVYSGAQKQDLTREDITRLGMLIGKLLHFEPCARASAREILDDPWFHE